MGKQVKLCLWCVYACVCGGGIDFKELFYSNHLSQGNLFRVIN